MATIEAPWNGRAIFDSLFPLAQPAAPSSPKGSDAGNKDNSHTAQLPIDRSAALAAAQKFLKNVAVDTSALTPEGVERAKAALKGLAGHSINDAFEICLLDWPELELQQLNLVDWYMATVRNDFYSTLEPALDRLWSQNETDSVTSKLQQTCEMILHAETLYTFPVYEYMMPALERLTQRTPDPLGHNPPGSDTATKKLTRMFTNLLQPVFMDTLAAPKFYDALSLLTLQTCTKYFKLEPVVGDRLPDKYEVHHEAGLQLMHIFEHLQHVGLSGKPASRSFAEAIEQIIVDFIDSKWMQVDWQAQNSVIPNMTTWVEKVLAPFIQRGQTCLNGEPEASFAEKVSRWLDVAIAWLGRSRIANLYSYVCAFPKSAGAIKDIKAYITSPEARKFLTTTFQLDVERRLLHAGATTKHILDVYILLIQTFVTLDTRGVLLDNVSRPVRRYLKGRSDTAQIIIASMLADVSADSSRASTDISLAIATEMTKPIVSDSANSRQDHDLDFDNMDYQPQPIDASPDFVRNQSNDATSHLLSLYDKEQFVNVLKGIFGEHLLKASMQSSLAKETHLLKLFKSRWGEDKLQACDVMLQDIINSREMHKTINNSSDFTDAAASMPLPGIDLTAQVLSSFFWPEMRDDEFSLPRPVKQIQMLYEQGFMRQHTAMKLEWLPSLGRATVELQLEDRAVQESVPTWVASVIYCFDDDNLKQSPSKSIDDLAEELTMDEPLVRNAISFWVGNGVLQETDGRFQVLERLSDGSDSRTASGKTAVAQEEVSAVKSAQNVLDENADMYMMFVQGMLMNQGSMPVPRILMMLKIALPGGFPFGEAEVRGLLQGMVEAGRLVQNGESFGVKK